MMGWVEVILLIVSVIVVLIFALVFAAVFRKMIIESQTNYLYWKKHGTFYISMDEAFPDKEHNDGES